MIKMVKNFFENYFETKKFFAVFYFTLLLFAIILLINFGNITLSRYSSQVDASIKPTLALFIVDVGSTSQTLELGEILPSSIPYFYTFTVSNFQEERRTNVNLEYEISFVTTTNLPLNYKIYKNSSDYSGNGIITSDTIIANDDGMYFRKLETVETELFTYGSNQTNTYTLRVEFPDNYKYNSLDYEGVIDLFEVNVFAKQVV